MAAFAMPPLLIGAHVSAAGGLPKALARGTDLRCGSIQVFVKNPSQWRAPALTTAAVRAFRRAHAESPLGPLVAHAGYLINLAATDREILERSIEALGDELDRCSRLGIASLVVHPGAHMGAGEEAGLDRAADSLRRVLSARPRCRTRLLLEITAGQGSVLGHRLEHLAELRRRSRRARRLGICIDTCHAFAAGYRLHEARGYAEFFDRVEELFGLERIGCLHLNDSLRPFGSRRDRHANIGRGEIGRGLFRRLLHDRRLRGIPQILETPMGDDGDGHRRDLALLRRLIGRR